MKGALLAMAPLLALAGCGSASHRHGHGQDRSVDPRPATAAPSVSYSPSISPFVGSWTSSSMDLGSGVSGFLRLDLASDGGFSFDVRSMRGDVLEIVESAKGMSKIVHGDLVGSLSRGSKGPILLRLSPWTASLDAQRHALVMRGADGKTYRLEWLSP